MSLLSSKRSGYCLNAFVSSCIRLDFELRSRDLSIGKVEVSIHGVKKLRDNNSLELRFLLFRVVKH